MDNKNITYSQKSILNVINMLVEFKEVEVNEIKEFDMKDILEGEKDFYLFMKELYIKMYNNPESYYIPLKQYDNYINGRFMNKDKRNDSKESKLRNTVKQSIEFYQKFFYEMALLSEFNKNEYSFIISKDNYNILMEKLNFPNIKNKQAYRINKIIDYGVEIQSFNENIVIKSLKYKKAFLGLWILTSVPLSRHKYIDYLRIDYKGIYKRALNINDVKDIASSNNKEIINLIYNKMKELKAKTKIKPLSSTVLGSTCKVDYLYNNKSILKYNVCNEYFKLTIIKEDEENNKVSYENPDIFMVEKQLKLIENFVKIKKNKVSNLGVINE